MSLSRDQKYVLEVVLFVVALTLLIGSCLRSWPLNFLTDGPAVWSYQVDYARTAHRGAAELLILGDSRVQAAILPADLSHDTRSMAMPASNPMNGFFLLRDYLKNNPAPSQMIISYASYHLAFGAQKGFWNHAVKVNAFDLPDFLEIVERSHRFAEPILPDASRVRVYAEWMLYRVGFPPYYLGDLDPSDIQRRGRDNREIWRKLAQSRGHQFIGEKLERHSGLAYESGFESFRPSPLNDSYLGDILHLAREHSIQVMMIPMPLNETTLRALKPGFVDEYRNYVSRIQAEFPEIVAISIHEALPATAFGDPNHLNHSGAQRYTRLIADRLRDMNSKVAARHLPPRVSWVGNVAPGR